MTGRRFGALVAMERIGSSPLNGNAIWSLVCDCGRQCSVDGYSVRSGKVTTCQACAAERSRVASVTHGMSGSREFATWTDIQTRCLNANSTGFKNYGGRGIKVCERWRTSFDAFLADMGPRPSSRHSIERDDVDGHYEPGNCRWATAAEQARNKRNNRRITINGVTKTMTDWASAAGLTPSAMLYRINAGQSGEALIAPTQRGGCLTFNGITDTYAGWAARTGIKASTIAMRINARKWPVARALTEGTKQ